MSSLILCHDTARLIHSALAASLPAPSIPAAPRPLRAAYTPNAPALARARSALAARGIDLPALTDKIDVLVPSIACKRNDERVRCHVWTHDVPAESLIALGDGIYVVGIEMCALQAAAHMSEPELIEYCFELCSRYVLPCNPGGDYTEIPAPRTTIERLRGFLRALPATRGKSKALRILHAVREGARSPMETAMTMMLTCPPRLGGLGFRDIAMDHRVEVTGEARRLTRRRHLYCDAFMRRGRQDMEYQGFHHDDEMRQAIDNERRAAMRAMGYTVVDINRQQLFDRTAFRRVIATICMNAGVDADARPDGFAERQEELRRFVLRRWL